MRVSVLATALLGVLLLGTPELRAQPYPYYGPFWDPQYQQYLQYQHDLEWQQYLRYLQQVDPYYDLHVMHYQLYRYQYQPYPSFFPCCYTYGIPVWSTPTRRVPHTVRNSPRQPFRRK